VSLTDGTKVFHRAKLFKRQNLFVLSLEGDDFEMGYQHGKLLQSEIAQGAMPQLAKMVEDTVRNIFPQIPILTDLIIKFLYRTETDRIMKYGIDSLGGDTDRFLAEAYGLSEGAQLPLDDVLHAAFGPESLQVILGKQKSKQNEDDETDRLNIFGQTCTDFASRGSYTSTEDFIIGRNTDYPLNGTFDRFPTVIYYQPTDGNQKYLALTSAGVHVAGVVGMNESGLYLGIHTIPTLEVSEDGFPTFMLGQYVLKMAKSFDEAVELFKKHRTAAGWAYTLVSTKENRMGIVELTNKHGVVTETNKDLLVQTNHFVSPQMDHANLDLNATVNEDTQTRAARVNEMANKKRGFLDPQEVVNILSDKWDSVNKKMSSLGNTVATHMTLSSMVVDTHTESLYIATGLAPVSLSNYIQIPTVSTFNPNTFSTESYEILESSTFDADYPKLAEAEQWYIEAKMAFDSDHNSRSAFEILKKAIDLVPGHSAFHFVRGIMALKAGLEEEAIKSFEELEKLEHDHYSLLGHYYLGRIFAHHGQKNSAREKFIILLKKADKEVESPLIKATKNNLNRLSQLGNIKLNPATLAIFMPEADMLKY
jgi:predicted choloylglycine hydrolase